MVPSRFTTGRGARVLTSLRRGLAQPSRRPFGDLVCVNGPVQSLLRRPVSPFRWRVGDLSTAAGATERESAVVIGVTELDT